MDDIYIKPDKVVVSKHLGVTIWKNGKIVGDSEIETDHGNEATLERIDEHD